MKKIILLLLILIFSFTLFNGCKNTDDIYVSEPYDYSDFEYKEDKSVAESLSIPEHKLKYMTTEALVKTIQNIPDDILLIFNAFTPEKFDIFVSEYNVLKELSKRKDKSEYIEKALNEYIGREEENATYIKLFESCK